LLLSLGFCVFLSLCDALRDNYRINEQNMMMMMMMMMTQRELGSKIEAKFHTLLTLAKCPSEHFMTDLFSKFLIID